MFCVPAFGTVGAIGGSIYGAIYGAVAAEPASEWEQAESAFKGTLSDLNIQQRVPNHIVEFARSQTPYRVIRVDNQDPSSKDEKAPYRALASKGVDAVLELTELTVSLRPSDTVINPPLSLVTTARARLIRTSDGALLDERVITVDDLSIERSLATWADQNAQAFRQEVTQAAQRLAQQVVKELFPVSQVKVARSGDVLTPSGGIALSVMFSRDISPETLRSFGEEMVECVTRDLAKAVPEARLVPEEEFHRTVFGVKPGEVFLRADTIRTLLDRPDIGQRVRESGLTHLILVGGATKTYPVKLGESMRSTQLTASIFELASGRVGHALASAEGSQVGGAPTESPACEALGAEVARAIRGKARDESR